MSLSPFQESICRRAADCAVRGGYPKPVIMFMGVIAFAKDEDDYKRLMHQSDIGHVIFAGGMIMLVLAVIGILIWWGCL